METFSASLALCAGNSPVTGDFPTQRPMTRNFDVFFDMRLNKRLSKQSWGWWFETLSCPLSRNCNRIVVTGRLWHLCRTGGGGNWYTYIRIGKHIHIESGAVITWLIFPQILKNTPHSASVVARYGVSFVYPASDWYSASVPIIICVEYYNFGVPYNGTRPYIHIYIYVIVVWLPLSVYMKAYFLTRYTIINNLWFY